MAIKKSDLYSSLWASCDELRGGMDASQYKDYVLFMLFIKYISDKYGDSDDFAPPVTIPKGASFKDMIALKGKDGIGDKINTQIIQPLIDANARLARSDFPDFNDPNKLGEGQAMIDRLTNLVAIFQKPELDFSKNRADNDDILGDAYEYLMRHFAIESGKSKGQFLTPSEVSMILAKVIGISPKNSKASTTAHDPTCGSGSLLLKVAAQAGKSITLEGQEKDVATAGLARMNMILHNFPTANILTGNTLAAPKFKDKEQLRTYDFVVANPPFSDKTWSTGLTLGDGGSGDPFQRFTWGVPPAKQGDYAYLLHIIRSLKSGGKGACILPHGVLFRGNAEGVIRQQLVRYGYLKAIIGLPANLFYGTGIPACILVLDKENAAARKGIFMIDASKGFMKDGPKNRLRAQDIHKIVDTFTRQTEVPRYARMVSVTEISDPKNDFNLNLPRYIDSTEPEDIQDINGHLRGGIPNRDIDAMERYWQVIPAVRAALFKKSDRSGYSALRIAQSELKATIFAHPEFTAFNDSVTKLFAKWKKANALHLKQFGSGTAQAVRSHAPEGSRPSAINNPKVIIETLSEDLLTAFAKAPLLDHYDIYQHLMDYWATTMQDDCYLIAADGWREAAKPRLVVDDKSKKASKEKPDFIVGKKKYKTELIPASLVIARYFVKEQAKIEKLETEIAALQQQMEELAEEHSGEGGLLEDAKNDKDKLTKASVSARLKELSSVASLPSLTSVPSDDADQRAALQQYLEFSDQEATANTALKTAQESLMEKVLQQYGKLTEDDIKTLVVDDKWLATLAVAVQGELDRVSQTLTCRIRQLAERYATPLPQLIDEVAILAGRVEQHLNKMGFKS